MQQGASSISFSMKLLIRDRFLVFSHSPQSTDSQMCFSSLLNSYWDDWIRQPEQRKDRACIRPEVSRTKTFGMVGVSK